MSKYIEDWARDLREAGWREVKLHQWEAPDGRLFIGPYGAWRIMKREQHKGERDAMTRPGTEEAP